MDPQKQKNHAVSVFLGQAGELHSLGLSAILEESPETFSVIGSARTAAETIERVQDLKPDIVLLSVFFEDRSGIEVVRVLHESCPATKAVMLTRDDCPDHMLAAFVSGAQAYYLHNVSAGELRPAILNVAAGSVSMSAAVAKEILALCKPTPAIVNKRGAKRQAQQDLRLGLTYREMQVLQLIVDGNSNVRIARQLYLSEQTVKTHVRHIMEKLVVSDRTQAAVKAIRAGILECPCETPIDEMN